MRQKRAALAGVIAAGLCVADDNPEAHPARIEAEASSACIQVDGEVRIEAAEQVEGKPRGPVSVSIVAYNGGPLHVSGYQHPVYLDLDGMEIAAQHPLLRDHDRNRIVGQVSAKRVGNRIEATGKLTGKSADRQEIEDQAADGYVWQASVGARPRQMEFVASGSKAAVNGLTVTGPVYVARKSRLAETSIVTIGADAETEVHLRVAAEEADGDEGDQGGGPEPSGGLTAIKLERARRGAIEAAAVRMINEGGDIDAIEAAMEEAITGQQSPQEFELRILRSSRPQGRISSGGGNELRGRDLELAVQASIELELGTDIAALEQEYDERILNAMDRHVELRRGLSLQDAMIFASDRNGHRVGRKDYSAMLRYSFPDVHASGLSNLSLSGIFSNIANKTMRQAFDAVEQAWREVSVTDSVTDFKEVTSYTLTGDMTYELVPPGGELKHATLGEATYTNRANTYGRMFALDRRDIINDDLRALRQVPRRLGRGGALKLNDVFWAVFLNSGSFFTAGNKNLISGGSASNWYLLADPEDMPVIEVVFLNGVQRPTVEQADADFKQLGIQMRGYHDFGVSLQEPRGAVKSTNALDIDGLKAAHKLFLDQTDRDNKPLAIAPRILLTSTSNVVDARSLYDETKVVGPTGGKNLANNPFAGMFRPVYSAYLPNA